MEILKVKFKPEVVDFGEDRYEFHVQIHCIGGKNVVYLEVVDVRRNVIIHKDVAIMERKL